MIYWYKCRLLVSLSHILQHATVGVSYPYLRGTTSRNCSGHIITPRTTLWREVYINKTLENYKLYCWLLIIAFLVSVLLAHNICDMYHFCVVCLFILSFCLPVSFFVILKLSSISHSFFLWSSFAMIRWKLMKFWKWLKDVAHPCFGICSNQLFPFHYISIRFGFAGFVKLWLAYSKHKATTLKIYILRV